MIKPEFYIRTFAFYMLLCLATLGKAQTHTISADVTFTDYKEHFVVQRDSRIVTIAFTYKFGKNSVQGSKKRQGGADDIKQRAGSGMG